MSVAGLRRAPVAAGGGARKAQVLQAYLRSLLGPRDSGQLVEIRFRRGARMSQCFFGRTEVLQAAQVILALGERTDVYVGAAPRTRAAGGKDAVRELWAVWADCDDEEARERLWDFRPAPSIVVATGSPHGCHAYWLLKRPLVPAAGEPANRRLAHALGADPRAVDAARILRPPGTFSFKRRPPVAVRLERFVPQRYDAHYVVGALPAPPERPSGTAHRRANGADPLRSIPPAQYVEALLGVSVGRDRKVRCPFHDDRTPSLHVYETPEGGWYCFGCGRGTSIYDLGAAVYGLATRGPEFLELRRRLCALFAVRSTRAG